jgi:hypothetical protein
MVLNIHRKAIKNMTTNSILNGITITDKKVTKAFIDALELSQKNKEKVDVTEKYYKMIRMFGADMSLAKDDIKSFSFDELIKNNTKDIYGDIDLLNELEFKIRHNQIVIMEVSE